MKKILAATFAVSAILVSCEPKPIHPVDVVEAPDFVAVIDNPAAVSRASFTLEDNLFHRSWDAADEILVKGSGSAVFKTTVSGDKADLEKVSGEAGNGPFTAYYPSDLEDNMVLPAVIRYSPLPSVKSPMVAVSNNKVLPFKSVTGLLAVNFTSDEEVVVKTVTITANQPLSGNYSIVDGNAVLSGSEGVVVDCGEEGVTVGSSVCPFYIELPQGIYDNIKFLIVDNFGRERVLALAKRPVTVERAKVAEYPVNISTLRKNRAVMISGPEFNVLAKRLASGSAVKGSEVADNNITKIVLDVKSSVKTGTEISDPDSDMPVYANYDSGVLTLSTEGSEIYTGEDASCLFRNFGALEEIVNLKALNTELATNMKQMFSQDRATTYKLSSLDLSMFNTVNVTAMDSMFYSMSALKSADISSFKADKCETMSHLFDLNTALTSVKFGPEFNSEKVTDMSYMFNYCSSLTDVNLENVKTTSVVTMANMFTYSSSLKSLNLSSFSGEKLENMMGMFMNCSSLESLDLTAMNTANVTNMNSLFMNCTSLKTIDLSKFDTTNVTLMINLFRNCSSIEELDLTSFNLTVNDPKADFIFDQMKSLKTLKLAMTFVIATKPNSIACNSGEAYAMRTSSIPGFLTIVCPQPVAEWCAVSTFRWLNSGYSGQKAIPVIFKDIDTGEEIPVTWPAN